MRQLTANEWETLRYCSIGMFECHASLRWSQAICNSLGFVAPDISKEINNTEYDCFYSSDVAPLLNLICPDGESDKTFIVRRTT
jgi:hypothetical protein